MNIEVRGSKNDFAFGPVTIEIPVEVPYREQPQAVLDAILQNEDSDGIDQLLPSTHTQQADSGGSRTTQPLEAASRRAAQHGFTALSYTGSDGKNIRIL